MDNQTQETSGSSSSKFVLPAVVAALIVFAAVGFYLYQNNSATPAPGAAGTSEMTQLETGSSAPAAVGNYRDGDYTATGKYVTPGGEREIDVEVTLANGVISDVTVTPKAEDATSQRFQGEFADNYKTMVVGKSIDEIALTKVSGSSLTPKGFTNALEQIKAEAKS